MNIKVHFDRMKKITLFNLHENKQYLAVVFTLARFPDGLCLQELTYLLSDKRNMNKLGYLTEKFNNVNRRCYFRSRQRICDVLRKLRDMDLVIYRNGKYSLDVRILFYWCEIRDAEKKYRDLFDDIEKNHPGKVKKIAGSVVPITVMYNFRDLWREYKNFDG